MPTGGLAERLQRLIDREKERAPHLASLRRLGADCGVSHAYLGRLMSGEQSNPTMDVLSALATRFKTTTEYLYHGIHEVNVWQQLLGDPRFVELSQPMTTRGARFAWVSRHLALTFAGHLSYEDQADHMGISPDSLTACLDGRWEPTDHQLQVLSALSGVPERWFRFGALAFVDFGEPIIAPAQIAQYLRILSLAAHHNMPPNILEMAVRLWAEGQTK